MKASLPQLCASSAFVAIVEAVLAVARPYPNAAGSNFDVSENAAVGMAKSAAVAIAMAMLTLLLSKGSKCFLIQPRVSGCASTSNVDGS